MPHWRSLVSLMLHALAIPPGMVAFGVAVSIGGLAWQVPGSVGVAPGVYLAEFSIVLASAALSAGLLVMGRRVQ